MAGPVTREGTKRAARARQFRVAAGFTLPALFS